MRPSTEIAVLGTVAPGFEKVRDAFAAVLADDPADPGAQLSAYVKGTRWSISGPGTDQRRLAHRNSLDDQGCDASRGRAAGARRCPRSRSQGRRVLAGVRGRRQRRAHAAELLAHRSGAIGVDGGFTLDELADDRAIAARLAPHRPYWTPGTAHGYHGLVIGALAGEVVRRVTGRSIQELFEERVRAPYGLDCTRACPSRSRIAGRPSCRWRSPPNSRPRWKRSSPDRTVCSPSRST